MYLDNCFIYSNFELDISDFFLLCFEAFPPSETNSGKTLPALIYPDILDELVSAGHNVKSGKVLFVTCLNSIQMSMVSTVKLLGLDCEAVTVDNYAEVNILFIGPEILKLPRVTRSLLAHREAFALKVIDEAHLGKYVQSI